MTGSSLVSSLNDTPYLRVKWTLGWGKTSILELEPETEELTTERVVEERTLGRFVASGVAGNAVLSSVFYAFPAVTAVCGA